MRVLRCRQEDKDNHGCWEENPKGIVNVRCQFICVGKIVEMTVLSVADDAASPVVLGSVLSTSYMDGAHFVASFPAAGLVFVTGFDSDSVCVVDVSDPSNPTVMEGLVDSTYMDGRCVVCSTDVSHKPHHNDPTKDPSGTTRGIVRNIG